MGRRQKAIIRAILKALLTGPYRYSILKRLLAFFAIFGIPLQRFEHDRFRRLREEVWEIDEAGYWQSFLHEDRKGRLNLNSLAELGFSGSTFFETLDHKYLIKSLPRGSESEFFKNELQEPYHQHMRTNPDTLLVRITDFLFSPITTIGGLLDIVPRHHVVMENLLYGRKDHPRSAEWETYDLKPADYFYPERDVLDGQLASQAAKHKVVDHFNDKIRITKDQRGQLLKSIEEDTEFLKTANAVDYSLFLVRYPAADLIETDGTWKTGILSSDKRWVYRAIILDFFWTKHKLPAKAMTALIKTYNTIDNQGHMSLTTSASEFKTRFCSMVDTLIMVDD